MTIKITKGDLLKQDTQAIVNTVNCVGVMGKGIALQFKRKWPENFKVYAAACKAKEVQTGKMFVHDLGALDGGKPEFIINFPTKNHWRGKSELSYIEEGLEDLVKVIKELKIQSISIPPLGCGNGGLEWRVVYELIQKSMSSLDLEVRLFSPCGAPDAKSMVTRTEKPKMSLGRAVLIKLLSIYREMDYSLSKIEIQKLCYFAQESGEILKLNYRKDQYGPYANNLHHVLVDMEGHYIEGFGDNDTALPQINLKDGALTEAEDFIKDAIDSQERVKAVSKLIEGFETPYGMELLATVHWVSVKDNTVNGKDDVVNAVYNWKEGEPEWNKRKKALMKESHILKAWDRLQDAGWLKN